MKTEQVMLQTLCVPCACRCRYCLLCWDGKTVGASWDAGRRSALRMKEWMRLNRPDVLFHFSFGYSMEHPDLRGALRFLRGIGSPQAEYLQCDGMRIRDEKECQDLVSLLAEEGVRHLNFTFYGLQEYQDRFAGRREDFACMLRLARTAGKAGLQVSAGIPLTWESAPQADRLIDILRMQAGVPKIFLFVPHEEGRGIALQDIRFSLADEALLSEEARSLLNRGIFRPESEWIAGGFAPETIFRMGARAVSTVDLRTVTFMVLCSCCFGWNV